MSNFIKEIKSKPQNFIGKTFKAECKFFVTDGVCTLDMMMRITDIRGNNITIEPANKELIEAKLLKAHWFGSREEASYAETFTIQSVFEVEDEWLVYCKFLEWC